MILTICTFLSRAKDVRGKGESARTLLVFTSHVPRDLPLHELCQVGSRVKSHAPPARLTAYAGPLSSSRLIT